MVENKKRKVKDWLFKNGLLFSEDEFEQSFAYLLNQNRPFLTLPVKANGKSAVLKLLLFPEESALCSLKNEALCYKKLSKIFNQNLNLFAGLPYLIDVNLKRPFPYFLRTLIKGKTVGTAFSYQGGLSQEHLKKIIKTLRQLTEYSARPFNLINYGIDREKWNEKIISYLKRTLSLKTQQKINLARLSQLAKKSFQRPLPKATLSHGDIIPGNIVTKNKEVYLIDWEKVFLGSPFYDCASLHAILWPQPALQKYTLLEIKKTYQEIVKKRWAEFQFYIIYHLIVEYERNPTSQYLLQEIKRRLE